ncbi:hypothetical protein V3391_13515 [Luteimonas sp. SMYT11W]|uniref:Peptidase M61 catalytic domain-containing protein n=1 Tax=Luteimonas flava TaxID=3115822 RepID=A0ABU7WJ74_9GAMM
MDVIEHQWLSGPARWRCGDRLCAMAITWGLLACPVGAQAQARIALNAAESGSRVAVEMVRAHCTARIVFAEDVPGGRRASWRLEAPWSWVDDREARSPTCLSRIAFSAPAESDAADREYPFVFASAAGLHVHLPALAVAGEPASTPDAVRLVSSGCPETSPTALTGYRLIDSCVQSAATTSIDARTPAWLAHLLETTFTDTLARGKSLFGALDTAPVRLFVRYDAGPGPQTWRGWTSGPELFLGFSGDWSEDDALRLEARKYVMHEVLHLWFGWKRPADPNTPAWLSEGFAEYFALDLMRERGHQPVAEFQRAIMDHYDRCLAHTAGGSSRPSSLSGASIYDCGVTAVYRLDRSLGSTTIAHAAAPWRSVFDSSGLGVTLDEVAKHYVAAGAEPITAGDIDRMATSPEEDGLGLTVIADTTSEVFGTQARAHLLQALVQQFCPRPPYGFTTFEDHVELDTGDDCGPLSGRPRVYGVEAVSLFGPDAAAAVEAAIGACERHMPIRLLQPMGTHLQVECRQPISRPKPVLRIRCAPESACDLAREETSAPI